MFGHHIVMHHLFGTFESFELHTCINICPIGKINRLTTATWTKGDKLYFLGAEVEERTLRGLL